MVVVAAAAVVVVVVVVVVVAAVCNCCCCCNIVAADAVLLNIVSLVVAASPANLPEFTKKTPKVVRCVRADLGNIVQVFLLDSHCPLALGDASRPPMDNIQGQYDPFNYSSLHLLVMPVVLDQAAWRLLWTVLDATGL